MRDDRAPVERDVRSSGNRKRTDFDSGFALLIGCSTSSLLLAARAHATAAPGRPDGAAHGSLGNARWRPLRRTRHGLPLVYRLWKGMLLECDEGSETTWAGISIVKGRTRRRSSVVIRFFFLFGEACDLALCGERRRKVSLLSAGRRK